MKAGVFTKIDTIEYREIEKPVITDSDMLIRVRAAAICGTDSRILHGNKTKGVRIPSVIGHEFSGEVVELGSEVKDFSIGDRVCVDPVLPCGNCQYCLNGMENVCLNREAIGYEHDGCFAEYVRVPGAFIRSRNVQRLPESVSWVSGALAEPLGCVINGQNKLHISPGETVVIIGAGPIGLMHCMLAKASGASRVIVSEPTALRRNAARAYGADVLVDPIAESLEKTVLELTDGVGADVIILAIGNPRIVNEALRIGAKGARVSFFAGFSKDDMPQVDVNLIHYNELVIVGSASLKRKDLKTALNLIGTASVNVEQMATHQFPLEQIARAFEVAEKGDAIKVVLIP
ncbi:MAG: zinc-dependent dehydrogenase [Spirochaetia bacterium]|nr:zinc-dependent dehydrogenase [Spirochaetia bacterium]MCF7942355.1 zinc-dependent dehydrogenase [Spirochaetia bacterium]